MRLLAELNSVTVGNTQARQYPALYYDCYRQRYPSIIIHRFVGVAFKASERPVTKQIFCTKYNYTNIDRLLPSLYVVLAPSFLSIYFFSLSVRIYVVCDRFSMSVIVFLPIPTVGYFPSLLRLCTNGPFFVGVFLSQYSFFLVVCDIL